MYAKVTRRVALGPSVDGEFMIYAAIGICPTRPGRARQRRRPGRTARANPFVRGSLRIRHGQALSPRALPSPADDHCLNEPFGLRVVPSVLPPIAKEREQVGAVMILTKQFKCSARRPLCIVRKFA
jgi:hypothetical protein